MGDGDVCVPAQIFLVDPVQGFLSLASAAAVSMFASNMDFGHGVSFDAHICFQACHVVSIGPIGRTIFISHFILKMFMIMLSSSNFACGLVSSGWTHVCNCVHASLVQASLGFRLTIIMFGDWHLHLMIIGCNGFWHKWSY